MQAQLQFVRKDSVPVYYNSAPLPYAWAGGFNSVQFSEIDLNQDGVLDLFAFDRAGNKIITFINTGTPNQVSYVLALQYVPKFPFMHDWVLLRDYNCDGKMDIFTSNASKVEVYKNVSTIANGLQFQLVTTGVKSNLTPNSTNNITALNVSWIDVPAIRDVDGDGDLDILNYGTGGTQIEYHKNLSEETYGTCDSLNFTLQTLCWGELYESIFDASISLNVNCPAPPAEHGGTDDTHNPFLHSGSCLECLNIDGDNDQDVIIGDLSNQHVNMVRNGGSNMFALSDSVDANYPGYDTTMSLDVFGCAFMVDVNNDGKKDLLFAPNALNSSANYKNVEYYQNTGSNNAVHAHYMQKDFLVGQMIDCGEGSYPVFFDYDNDGDEDLFIGNKGYYDPSGIPPSMIALYENTGTNSVPVFTHKSSDFAGIFTQNLGINGLAPTFGDIDNDGDDDMIVGDVNGKLYLFTKNPGSDTNFVLTQSYYMNIDVGSFAAPQLVDVDGDGLLDLLVGEQSGNVNYFHNNGTSAVANFSSSPTNALFGNIIVTQSGFTTGYSAPLLFKKNGHSELLVGSERGFLFDFDSIDGNITGNFRLKDSLYVSRYEGGRIAVAVTDLNHDSLIDVVIGNYAGGVSLFYGDNTVSIEELDPSLTFNLFPNPASDQLTIETAQLPSAPENLSIYNLSGQLIYTQSITQQKTNVNISAFANGIYVCTITDKKGFSVNKKLVISK